MLDVGISAVILPAAAAAVQYRAVYDQFSHISDIPQFEQVTGHFEIPIIFANLFLKVSDALGGSLQAFVGADNPDVVPHQPPDFIPIMAHNDQLVGIMGITRLPLGNIEIEAFGSFSSDVRGS